MREVDPARRALGRRGLRQGLVVGARDLGGLRGVVPRAFDDRAVRDAGRDAVWPEIVTLAGGPDAVVAAAAATASTAGERVEAVQLLRDGARGRAGPRRRARVRSSPRTRCSSTEHGAENFWLAGWLQHQIAGARAGSTRRDRPVTGHATTGATSRSRRPRSSTPRSPPPDSTTSATRRGATDSTCCSVRSPGSGPERLGRMILRDLDRRAAGEPPARRSTGSTPTPRSCDAPIAAPIIVVGMLRTGSTLLCELLAADPANRPLMKWEGLNSDPAADDCDVRTDPRIAAEVEKQEAIYSMVPAAQGGALGARRRPDRVRGAAHPERSEPRIGTGCSACRVRRVVPRLRHAARVRLPPALAPAAAIQRAGPVVAQGAGAPARARRAPRDVSRRAHRGAAPRPAATVPSSASLSVNSRPDSLSHTDFRDHFPGHVVRRARAR